MSARWPFLSVSEVRGYLGPPDHVIRDGRQKLLQYYYDRFGEKDWVVTSLPTESEHVFGYNARSWEPNLDNNAETKNGARSKEQSAAPLRSDANDRAGTFDPNPPKKTEK